MRTLLSILAALAAAAGCCLQAGGAECVVESAREIPVAGQVDVLVVGGSTWAVAAAASAAETGATVFLLAPRSYLGDDLCATLRLALAADQTADDPLARQIFGSQTTITPPTILPNSRFC